MYSSASPKDNQVVGFDTAIKLRTSDAQDLAALGFCFALPYLPLSGWPVDQLDAAYLDLLTAAGFAVMAIQHGRSADWTEQRGKEDGNRAAEVALAAGLPAATTVFCDLEGSLPSAQAAIDYGCAWYAAAKSEGLLNPALYEGAGIALTSIQLYQSLPFETYARSFSNVPGVAQRGYRMLQLPPANRRFGYLVADVDVVCADYLGQTVTWCVRD
jgi:hypothetical protein